ncbi:UNVERIFIED_CONTAM: hypothetical protein RMT77_015340 [Armadillidium vulgare]
MDVINEVDIKVEVIDLTEEDKTTNVPLEQVSTFEQIKERNYFEFINMKSEIEVKEEHLATEEEVTSMKEEHLATEEEVTSNDKLFDQNYSLDQNQNLMSMVFESENSLKSRSPPGGTVTPHTQIESPLQNVICRFCNLGFKSLDELKIHLKTQHKLKFKCSHCNFGCNKESKLNTHLLTHKRLFKCPSCSYQSYLKSNFKRHMLTHPNAKFKCPSPACSFECNKLKYLQRHVLEHDNVILFKCSECSFGTNHKGKFKGHMRTHSYGCNSKSNLVRDMSTHANVKLFKCFHCSYECDLSGNLNLHMLTQCQLIP